MIKLKCEILSPIHIGTGSQLDPMNYVIKGEMLYVYSLDRFIGELDDKQRTDLERILDSGNIVELRKYVSDRITPENSDNYSVRVLPNMATLYKEKINDIQNQLLINPFMRTGLKPMPFIPGSSIKGAIRTALVSELALKSNLPKPRNYKEEFQFEPKVLKYRDAKEDPFRGLKIKDVLLKNEDTFICKVQNCSRKEKGGLTFNDIQLICEVTNSTVSGKTIEFDMQLSFDDKLFSTKFLSNKLSKEQIIQSCNNFYKPKMQEEHDKFYRRSDIEGFSKKIMDTSLDSNSFFLRVGRFSGVECVTLDKYRNPRPPRNKTIWGTSRNLADGTYPMGWLKATFIEV